jgi:hypothetical protein
MATTDLMIGIGAEYKGAPAFKKALTDTEKLTKSVKSLAKGYVGLLGAQKALRYGMQSIKAFAQDDLAAQKLAKTVGNLGLAYEATNVEKFIQGLEKTFHIADDVLRPAFSRLIQVTGSYTKSKELLTTALNASAGAGVDLGTTVQDLAQAYVGNLRGLRKYNLGLTQAELATMSFQEIQDKLNTTFTGQGALAADSYAFKLEALAIASNNAKEIIGKGLTDAIENAFGNGDIATATTNIEKMAQAVSDVIAGLGTMAGFIGKIVRFTDKFTVGNFLQNRQPNTPYDPRSGNMPDMSPEGTKIVMERRKRDAESAKRQKEIAALAGKQTKALKEQTALTKAKMVLDKTSAVFNLDLIQNTAALQGKITEDETLRLKLQREILLGNADAAGKLAQELLSVQIAAMMAGSVDPFGNYSKSAIEAMKSLLDLRNALGSLGAPQVISGAELLAQDYAAALADANDPQFNLPSSSPMQDYQDAFSRPNTANSYNNVVISIDPTAAQYGISAAVVNNASNGNSNDFRRTGTGF